MTTTTARLAVIAFGSLPTKRALCLLARLSDTEASEVLAVMRRSLARFGANETLRAMLAAYGFGWSAPAVSELDLDVAAVADALSSQVCERCAALGYREARVNVCGACRGAVGVAP